MFEIEISDSQNLLSLDQTLLRSVAEKTLSQENVAAAAISLAFVNNQEIRALNKKYLEHDFDTDVLSFLLECDDPQKSGEELHPRQRGQGKRVEGEVIVSTETAIQNARNYQWAPHEEVTLYLVHGLLHLLGYDDMTSSEKNVMRSREREILALFNLTPHYDDNFKSDSTLHPGADS